jgi:5'(3')-deoxyribonucleotidase
MLNYEYIVFIDLDGVLAHFEHRVKEITGKHPKELSQGKLWGAVDRYNKEVQPFFETLEKMPGADKLWNFCTEHFHVVKVLTATGWTPRDGADQKTRWVHKHYGKQIDVKTVTSGTLKAIYANPRSILVDDTSKAIDPWVKAGGIGILHTDAESSIKQLQQILDRQ